MIHRRYFAQGGLPEWRRLIGPQRLDARNKPAPCRLRVEQSIGLRNKQNRNDQQPVQMALSHEQA
jgi:hypothetical protein